MSVVIPDNAKGPIVDLALPPSVVTYDLILRNTTTARSLTLVIPANWDGRDLVLDFYRRTIADQNGEDRSDLLDHEDKALWIEPNPLIAGPNDLEIESVRESKVGIAGPNLSNIAGNDKSVGTREWKEVNNVKKVDGSDALCEGTGKGEKTQSNYLAVTDFGLIIPSAAAILGIEASMLRETFSVPGVEVTDAAIKLIKNGEIQATDKSKGEKYAVGGSEKKFGGAKDLWEGKWVPGSFDSKFGLAVSANLAAASGWNAQAGINWIKMAVYYQEAAIVASLRWNQGYF